MYGIPNEWICRISKNKIDLRSANVNLFWPFGIVHPITPSVYAKSFKKIYQYFDLVSNCVKMNRRYKFLIYQLEMLLLLWLTVDTNCFFSFCFLLSYITNVLSLKYQNGIACNTLSNIGKMPERKFWRHNQLHLLDIFFWGSWLIDSQQCRTFSLFFSTFFLFLFYLTIIISFSRWVPNYFRTR